MKKTKKKLFFRTITGGTFPFDILFTIGTTEQEVIEYITKNCGYNLDDEEKKMIQFRGTGRTIHFKNNSLLLWVKRAYIPVLAHEVFHVVELLLSNIYTPLKEETSETYAYLTEYIWKQICHLEKDWNKYL